MRLVKKLKTGKIGLKEFNEKMKELDPKELEEEEFEQKTILSRK